MARTRYRLDRVEVAPLGSRPASWTFAGEAVRGTEFTFVATDRNLSSRNAWEFLVRVPADARGRVEVRPRSAPPVKAWEELPDRSLTFLPATRGTARGRWYCQVALADAAGEQSKRVVKKDQRHQLPHWFKELGGRMRHKEAVKLTKGTDADALVVLSPAGDYADMIRLFFAMKVWILKESVVLPARERT
jgi:hypothetical protein